MRFALTGSRAQWRSKNSHCRGAQAGFTLLEALVALAIVLAFAAALGPFLFQARQIMTGADRRFAAQNLLRSLLENPLHRPSIEAPLREGETSGLQWRVLAEPLPFDPPSPEKQIKWIAFRVTASVSWTLGQSVSGETVRLGRIR